MKNKRYYLVKFRHKAFDADGHVSYEEMTKRVLCADGDDYIYAVINSWVANHNTALDKYDFVYICDSAKYEEDLGRWHNL